MNMNSESCTYADYQAKIKNLKTQRNNLNVCLVLVLFVLLCLIVSIMGLSIFIADHIPQVSMSNGTLNETLNKIIPAE